ncbi:hypothetical protein J2W42_002230 [Rhizobium tibeticum]|uniref:hypothetical protein n=1 Tax=Rhizobium tibeticum TaxID=501024 RepID=UPI002783A222|nr:hypothetical protein [Rhizobium tibeticum]MDP9809382.1 hypothetical protein [Rhizobium tibeticum]
MTVVASKYARAENDLYQTEPWVTEALLSHFPVAGLDVWEPAAGNHLMADVIAEQGGSVYTSDIAIYSRQHDELYDFLRPHGTWPVLDAIITNPPYGKGNRDARLFAEYALTRCKGLVALLLTAKFDFGNTRKHLFQNNSRFAAKISLTDRISWTLDGVTGTEDHAWYVWTETPRLPRSPVILYAGRSA